MKTASGHLGFWTATSLVVGIMIGSGVFLLPAALAPFGAASLLGWGLSFSGALMLALVFAWLAQAIPAPGGVYAYARAGFGDAVAFLVAWSYWICCWCANAALAVAFAGSLSALWPSIGTTPMLSAMCALAALWCCTLINLAGVRRAGTMQLFTTLLKVLPLLIFGVLGLAHVRPDAYPVFNPSSESLGSVTTTVAALTLWAFLGLESAAVASGTIQAPERNVPRATVLGMLIAGSVIILSCTAVMGMLPMNQLQTSSAPMALAASVVWGPLAGVAVGTLMSISCVGALNGNTLIQTQTPLAGARDGLFPKRFARVDARGTPVFGLLLSAVLATVLVLANASSSLISLFKFSILLSTATALLPYAVCTAAWVRLNPQAGVARKSIALMAYCFSIWALIGTGSQALIWGIALLTAGLPVYCYAIWERKKRVQMA